MVKSFSMLPWIKLANGIRENSCAPKLSFKLHRDISRVLLRHILSFLLFFKYRAKALVLARSFDRGYSSRSFEQEIWHDLAYLYISLSQWRDAEICLSKSKATGSYSAVRYHATGVLYERKGLLKEAMKAFRSALDIDPDHVPSLISAAGVLRQLGTQSSAVIKSMLMNALRVDRMNPSAWYNLGLLHKAEDTASALEEAAECFEAAAILEESAPVEPFR
ncbi:hypothetical protein CRYUN_Cryun14cG0117300 [Craigia yunnanensis]